MHSCGKAVEHMRLSAVVVCSMSRGLRIKKAGGKLKEKLSSFCAQAMNKLSTDSRVFLTSVAWGLSTQNTEPITITTYIKKG